MLTQLRIPLELNDRGQFAAVEDYLELIQQLLKQAQDLPHDLPETLPVNPLRKLEFHGWQFDGQELVKRLHQFFEAMEVKGIQLSYTSAATPRPNQLGELLVRHESFAVTIPVTREQDWIQLSFAEMMVNHRQPQCAQSEHTDPFSDPKDVRCQLLQAMLHRIQSRLDAEQSRLSEQAITNWQSTLDSRLPYAPPRLIAVFNGPLGESVTKEDRVCTVDGRTATLDGERILLGVMKDVDAILESGERLSVLDSSTIEPNVLCQAASGIAVTCELSFEAGDLVSFPGLLWDATASLTSRIVSVEARVASCAVQLEYCFDKQHRLLIRPQLIQFASADSMLNGTVVIELKLAISPGELRYMGTFWLNAVELIEQSVTEVSATPAGSFSQLLRRRIGIGVTQPCPGYDGREEEAEVAFLQRISAALRHRNRLVTAQDFCDIAAVEFPAAQIFQCTATRTKVDGVYRDAVRVVVGPRTWQDKQSFLCRALALSHQMRQAWQTRMIDGVHLVVGPPCLWGPASPKPTESLWCYRDFLISRQKSSQHADGLACRTDGTYWPIISLEHT